MRFATLIGIAVLLLQTLPAAAQSTPPSAGEQGVQDHVYQSCISSAKLGNPGGELEANCQCEAQVTLSLLTDDARKALADGTYASYKGAMFKVDQDGYSRLVIKSCAGVRPVLMRQICDPDPSGSACAKLKAALQAAQ